MNTLRDQPLGEDAGGSRFWFFASQQEDTCLYRSAQGLPVMRCTCRRQADGVWPPVTAGHRQHSVSTPAWCAACREDPPGSRAAGKKRKLADTEEEEAAWSTMCLTLEDLQEFAQKLGTSRQAGCPLHLQKQPLVLKQLSADEVAGHPTSSTWRRLTFVSR